MNESIDKDSKMQSYAELLISRTPRKELECRPNSIKAAAFRSLSDSIGWLGIAETPFCPLVPTYLQQIGPAALIKDLVLHTNMLRGLKKRRTSTEFNKPADKRQ